MARLVLVLLLGSLSPLLWAHGVDDNTRTFLQQLDGSRIGALFYIGAKHMVTGYDHLLFLAGVVFFLRRRSDILVYVSLFTLGHSLTLLGGVLGGIRVNAWLIDAIIGLSVAWKAFDNLGGFRHLLGFQPDNRPITLIFGLFHGLGLATKLQEFELPANGLLSNLVAFNIGVEAGQCLALLLILLALNWLRLLRLPGLVVTFNALLMLAGFVLTGYQLCGFWLSQS
ncbi:HupE/UreJ family protein [Parathalassolituus penaei]|uniref:HupE/UreJ family protein n=1 Tax=Parathalassolituus penaei TaxID=2997323 RepID=A0A9X3EJ78_9GAMM|nr:HupE/UreJ family protein [Parathalassolituus penaei]MCY0965251.1 HupE/UreJ family protein [Parathalassolituus penaei]